MRHARLEAGRVRQVRMFNVGRLHDGSEADVTQECRMAERARCRRFVASRGFSGSHRASSTRLLGSFI